MEDADAWQVGDCTLNKHTWDPLFGRWVISEFINRWQYSSCLRYTGWYTRTSDGPWLTKDAQRAHELFKRDPQLLSGMLDLATAAGAIHVQDAPRNSAKISRMPVEIADTEG